MQEVKKIEKNGKMVEVVEQKKVIPILIIMFLFGSVLGYVIHEQIVGYNCKVAFSDWKNSKEFTELIPLEDMQERLNEIDKELNVVDLELTKENLTLEEI